MEINKQLFEDVLSGKLKGTFILRINKKIEGTSLRINPLVDNDKFPYVLIINNTYFGLTEKGVNYYSDIVDFIPDTNMKENESMIEIPKGKTVDWEESKKQNKIVLRDKQLTYEEVCDRLPGMIDIPLFDMPSEDGNALVANEHYLECILAKNKLATVAKYLNDGWKPLCDSNIFLLIKTQAIVSIFEVADGSCASDCGSIWFKSREIAQQAIEILGEETVKLALEPLGV